MVETLGYGIFSLLTPATDGMGEDVAKHILTSAYSRGDELDADRRGMQLLNDAGLDSHGLARFFDTMQEKGTNVPGALEFLSTHPTGDRRQAAVKDLEQAGERAMTDAEWTALRSICESKTDEPTAVGS
jgi:predicted Zn-dependent protease